MLLCKLVLLFSIQNLTKVERSDTCTKEVHTRCRRNNEQKKFRVSKSNHEENRWPSKNTHWVIRTFVHTPNPPNPTRVPIPQNQAEIWKDLTGKKLSVVISNNPTPNMHQIFIIHMETCTTILFLCFLWLFEQCTSISILVRKDRCLGVPELIPF